MKKTMLFLTILMTCFSALNCQAQKVDALKEKVKIVRTGSRAVVLLDDFFNEVVTKSILQQINPDRLQDVKNLSSESRYPECFSELMSTDEDDVLFPSLTAYRIAKFDNIRNGENFGEQSILWVPGEENKNLMGSDCAFEGHFYIMLDSSDIELQEE